MLPDEEGFLQPVVDAAKCVGCGKCEAVCPVLHPGKPRKPLAVYAAKAKDDELRWGSASGGVFTVLAQDMLKRGGVVFGAGFERPTWRVIHKAATNEEELDDLRGSKYVQSDTGDTFKETKSYLDAGREVLYSGCPCQIAALKSFLRKNYPNLLTVDLICHGVPSPLAWSEYLKCHEGMARSSIVKIWSRRYHSWRKYSIQIDFVDDVLDSYSKEMYEDRFLAAFLREWIVRRRCYLCPFRQLRSGSDITIGDFWGVEKCHPDWEDEKGLSVVLINTEKGFPAATSRLIEVKGALSFDEACIANNRKTLLENCRPSCFRPLFMLGLKTFGFNATFTAFDLIVKAFGRAHHTMWWIKRLVINREFNKF